MYLNNQHASGGSGDEESVGIDRHFVGSAVSQYRI